MKRIKLFCLVFVIPFLLAVTIKHEFYLSVTKVEYIEKEKSIQIISQIFIDDFEKVLQERYSETIELAPDSETDLVDLYMAKYLAAKLKLKVNNNEVNFKFLGKAYKDDAAYCYLEINNITTIKSIEITNQILLDLYPEQQNILRTKIKGKDKSFMLVQQNQKAVLNFD